MQDRQRTIGILEALAGGTDPLSGEVFPPDSPYQQADVIRALFYALAELKAAGAKGNQGGKWTEAEDLLLKEGFAKGLKTSELAKMHGRSNGAIRSRIIKIGAVEKG